MPVDTAPVENGPGEPLPGEPGPGDGAAPEADRPAARPRPVCALSVLPGSLPVDSSGSADCGGGSAGAARPNRHALWRRTVSSKVWKRSESR
eukprot:366096-Chlamydomonas_euryale.AAC.2